ncbi:HAD family hydrolase [Streptomyces sp. KPB2]|uniref:HAD family hydrolase n=1 Tax=Streptomyces TaxID=1883 RepID=UPI000F6E96E7|nr:MULTISPECIES: HAD family hydrolase [Streptomyces]WSU04675.1 HAD family hydrolase [Streptomyces sp. NBC_01124]AZM78696.1 HAD family hydrolase [Streptomyces sp. KPB2]MBH5130995.1 HAD family hydrolase [Streptomyces sp. HB-N217]MDU0252928.1 HAD family hydrolase [Streptomyces sp. PU10]QKW64301.1 HAD family hydrolase [Streptomyces sp. NA03103]
MKLHAQALLFDNDGTLVSSLDSVRRCWTRWAVEYGITAERFGRVELHGRPAAEIAADLLPTARVAEAVARIEQLEVEDVPGGGVHLLPGTREFLDALPADRWAVVTSATRRLAEARLDAVGILPKSLVAADDITRGKPDPEPYLLGARALGVDPAACVVFEDAPAGLRAGRAAGMRTVALATTHPAGELDADLVVEDLSALSALVTDAGIEISVRD